SCLSLFVTGSSLPTRLPLGLPRSFRGYFFFSSRRRHTRCYRDWSSDVCSSDLLRWGRDVGRRLARRLGLIRVRGPAVCKTDGSEIGRASGRERVWIAGGAEAVNDTC